MKIAELIELIDGFAPYSTQAEYDNSGLCLGDPEEQIDAVLLTTDVTPEVVEEALDKGCNVILSHHPVIFGSIRAITPADGMRSEVLIKAIKSDVALISAHTNLDACDGGLNDRMATMLGLQSVEGEGTFVRVGELEPDATATLEEYAAFVSEKLGDPTVRYVGDGGRLVQKVAVSTGAGGRDGEMFAALIARRVDALVTAEVKHNLALEAKNAGLGVIECTHHATERCAVKILGELLEDAGVEFYISEKDEDPYHAIDEKE